MLICIMIRKSTRTNDYYYFRSIRESLRSEAAVFFICFFDCSCVTWNDPEVVPWHLPLASGMVCIQSVNSDGEGLLGCKTLL